MDNHAFPLGTICSGFEPMIFVGLALTDAVAAFFKVAFVLTHAFSCEVCPDRRDFMVKMHGAERVGCLFGDVVSLADETTQHDFITGKPCRVLEVTDHSN